MSRKWVTAWLALAMAGMFGANAAAIRNKPKADPTVRKGSPEKAAADALNRGLARLNAADRVEKTAPAQARRNYEAALKQFQEAVALAPDNYRAHNGLGYSYRKLGDYERALDSYERALKLAPGFLEAIEYRAEAYLALNRLEDVKRAYLHLFVHDRTKAAVLMNAMKSWVESRRTNHSGVDPAVLSGFEAWVRERDALAAATVNLAHTPTDWK